MEAGLGAEHAGHSDHVGVVVLQEVLRARGVGDGSLQGAGERDDLIVRVLAPGAAVYCDALAGVDQRGSACELLHRRQHAWRGAVDGERGLVRRLGGRDVGGDDQHGDAPLREGSLCGHRRLAARLLGRADLLAEDAASCVDLLEVDLLREVEA